MDSLIHLCIFFIWLYLQLSGTNFLYLSPFYLMTDSQLLQEFEALAHRLNIPLSREDLMGGTGGLCVVRGEQRLILDYRLDVPTQVDILAHAFSQLPLDDVFIKPSLRARIDLYGEAQV